MNKRSAMFVAAGLVLAMVVAGVAMAMGVTGPSTEAKTARSGRSEPIVKTVTRTVKVHKEAKADEGGGVIVRTLPAGDTPSPSMGDDESTEVESEDHAEEQESEDGEHESEHESEHDGDEHEGDDD
jgi:hypothetical protein